MSGDPKAPFATRLQVDLGGGEVFFVAVCDGDGATKIGDRVIAAMRQGQGTKLAHAPVPMILTCPMCGVRHIDAGEFAVKPHHTHACQGCGLTWRPAVVPTVGVKFLPGFKDGA